MDSWQGFTQDRPVSNKLIFLSDCQQPMRVEKLRLKSYRNEEARDSLLSDILRQRPQYLFLLGDLTSASSIEKSWEPIDSFLHRQVGKNIQVMAIPGNHEYYSNAKRGIRNFRKRFPADSKVGSVVKADSLAVILLNSNFSKLSSLESQEQQIWYLSMMDSLDVDSGIKAIFVCTHHSPYTNSKIVRPSKQVLLKFVPRFADSPKSKLFITGHSHNLEYFNGKEGKKFMVIGGGGGLTQPLQPARKAMYVDLIQQEMKPLFFYLIIERKGNSYSLSARGLQKEFSAVKTFQVDTID